MKHLSLGVLGVLSQTPLLAVAGAAGTPMLEPIEVQFDSAFFNGGMTQADISRFDRGNPVMPGSHRIDLYVNERWLGREVIDFRAASPENNAKACFTPELLERLGVDMEKLMASAADQLARPCIDLAAAIPSAQAMFDVGEQRLDISIPQAAMLRHARGYVDPKSWDNGITAARLNYHFNGHHNEHSGRGGNTQAYLGLDAGLNVAGWQIRQQSSMRWSTATSQWQNIATYAQHDITAWRSRVTVGDAHTTGELYDSTPFRGVRVASDDRMLPDSMTGYAPIVRGVAETNARVEVRQNGYTIYETTVAPGPFEINDLYATGYGGNLEVAVIEADGRRNTFTVPYAAVSRLMRPGMSRYSAMVGQVRNSALIGDSPYVAEATYQRGINNWATLYTGGQTTANGRYASVMGGGAFNTPIGAVSADITYSSAKLRHTDRTQTGHSARVTYSKSLPAINTNFALAAYRYSSRDYLSLSDAVTLDDRARHGNPAGVVESVGDQRNRFQLTLNQRLGEKAGSLYLSGSRSDYWNTPETDTTYQLGYNNRFKSLSYSITASRTRATAGNYNNQYFLSLSVPLGRQGSAHRPMLTAGADHGDGRDSARVGVTGTAGNRNQMNYGAYAATSDGDTNVGFNGQYNASQASLGASYSHAKDYQQLSISAMGGIVVHPGGVTFSQSLGETIAVVEAKGATGASVASANNIKVDSRGYAVVPSLTPYRMNNVELDPKGIPMDVELQTSSQLIAPRAGVVVALSYPTANGQPVFLRGVKDDGQPLPFGAQVIDAQGMEVGLVGQGGLAFLRGLADSGTLSVKWGENIDDQCVIAYHLPPRKVGEQAAVKIDVVCHGGAQVASLAPDEE